MSNGEMQSYGYYPPGYGPPPPPPPRAPPANALGRQVYRDFRQKLNDELTRNGLPRVHLGDPEFKLDSVRIPVVGEGEVGEEAQDVIRELGAKFTFNPGSEDETRMWITVKHPETPPMVYQPYQPRESLLDTVFSPRGLLMVCGALAFGVYVTAPPGVVSALLDGAA